VATSALSSSSSTAGDSPSWSPAKAVPQVIRRWGWLWVLVSGMVLFELVRRAIIYTGNPNYLPSLILIGAAVVPTAFVAFVSERQLPYDVSAGMLVVIAVLGGVVGGVTAGTVEYNTLRSLGTLPMVLVAIIEECAKLLVPLAILIFTRHRRHPADGLLMGVAAGAGFAVLETMGYALVALIQSQGSLDAVDGLLVLRGVLSPAGHMAWTGLASAALWQAAGEGWRARAVLRFAGVLIVAIALHAIWDSSSTTPAYVVVAVVSLALLLITVHRLRLRLAARSAPSEHDREISGVR
jgi:RsiW-degrading membrane proteinase PrsW (M82 family)